MNIRNRILPAALTAGLVALSAPAAAQQGRNDLQAELHIDVATHAMPGAPGMGALGRLAGAMAGGGNSYGQAHHPGMPGRHLDIALLNHAHPGTPAQQAVPQGLRLGPTIDLLPPERSTQASGNGGVGDGVAVGTGDGTFRVRYFWGCGETLRAGNQAEFTVTIRDGKMVQSGRSMTPRQVPGVAETNSPRFALWPNPGARARVAGNASLVGNHALTGQSLPASMRFELGADQDFMPELTLRQDGTPADGLALHWEGVDHALGYFAHATAMDGETMVMWSSSEDGYAGQELMTYLPSRLVEQWTTRRTLMPATARECRIPREAFAGVENAPMVQMIAYGKERTISQPGWKVTVRNKSTAMLMPGMSAGQAGDAARPSVRDSARGLLRGLIRR